MSEQPKGPPERRDASPGSRILTPIRITVAAAAFMVLSAGGYVVGCRETEQEQRERHDRDVKKQIADVYDEMVRTGDLPPGVRPEQLTQEDRAWVLEATFITMEGILWNIEREPIFDVNPARMFQNHRDKQSMRDAHPLWVREHLKDGILAALELRESR